MTGKRILLAGVTGYIGGSVLHQLLHSKYSAIEGAEIACLVRGEARVAQLHAAFGPRIKVVGFEGLEDTEALVGIASQYDVIFNMTLGYHLASALAFIKGLSLRHKSTGRDVWMVHTSGVSNLADQPLSGAHVESNSGLELDDSKDDIHAYEKARNTGKRYIQRTTELGMVDAGVESGVKTVVLMSPLIYGVGTGLWNKRSLQVPRLAQAAISEGHAIVIGDGEGVWDNVHIEDLAGLYELVLTDILSNDGASVPTGKQGVIFSAHRRHKWIDLSQGVADAAFEAGMVKSKTVKSVSLADGAKLLTGGVEQVAELGFASTCRTRSEIAKVLGWHPKVGIEAWGRGFAEEIRLATKNAHLHAVNASRSLVKTRNFVEK
ncbi:nad dependent epimerase dehydratase family protein [Stemphylium lycopersici]|uniref:Nad dependent epimerase dehydratase family protein n=1 Tax=Stemphylium lycopersici TaxID=183478 RepID=A0A364MVB6_STELY|nr:nad dependent epimerase dehydratase family protein [Stemphylium lycopersici]RAR04616.1 nad dependent epimerase dehydratase family protein [Stemphylium lycopersici]